MQARASAFHGYHRRPAPPRQRPESIGTIFITESPVAIVVTALLVFMMTVSVPESIVFFLGVAAFGCLTGYVLWRRHASGF
jgi:hypothetical protein